MKKIISICCLALALFFAGNLSVSAANHVYTLDIDIINPGLFTEVGNMIGGVEFDVFGGAIDQDWTLALGDAILPGQGNWSYQTAGTLVAVYDDYDWETPLYAPMTSGNVLTISSDVELIFSNPDFFSFYGDSYDSGYFTTQGFVEQNSVPIPGGIILLGSGLIGLIGLKRRK